MRHHAATPSSRLVDWIKHGRILAVLAVILASGTLAAVARADGDPASDDLITNQVFLTSQSSSLSSSQRQLLGVVQAANRAGFAIRVAIISSDYDLGSITALWRQPRIYARFLGLELALVYKQRLLVVMPNGFGFNWPKHSVGSTYRLLTNVSIGPGDAGLTAAAQTAVQRLAAASGVKLAPSTDKSVGVTTAGKPQSDGRVVIISALLVALALALLLMVRRRGARLKVPRKPSVASISGSPIRFRWALPGLAVLIVAVAAPILIITKLRHVGEALGVPAGSVVTPPPFSWPAGRRVAPTFVLRDQDGRRVSVAAYRGRPVIVTFIDPLCRNLCPLEAKVLNDVVSRMPARRRPEILAVSVDVYANARANLLQDVRKWELVPQWRWAVGQAAQLAAVWKRYEIGVSVTTKRIAGTTINYITHTEAAYIIDGTGHERALFVWPFYPQDVQRTLQQLS